MLFNLPNMLTLSRIIAIPLVVACFWLDRGWAQWLSMILFVIAAVTDWFDGYFARRYHQISRFGRFLDPIADKLVVGAILMAMTATQQIDGWSVLPALIIMCREIMVSGLREYLATLKIGVPVTLLAKWKTTAQMVASPFLVYDGVLFGSIDTRDWGAVLILIAAILTIWSMVYYMKKALPEIRARVK